MSIPNFFGGKTFNKTKTGKQTSQKPAAKSWNPNANLFFSSTTIIGIIIIITIIIIAIIIIISRELIGYHILKEGTLSCKNTNLGAVKVSIKTEAFELLHLLVP